MREKARQRQDDIDKETQREIHAAHISQQVSATEQCDAEKSESQAFL